MVKTLQANKDCIFIAPQHEENCNCDDCLNRICQTCGHRWGNHSSERINGLWRCTADVTHFCIKL